MSGANDVAQPPVAKEEEDARPKQGDTEVTKWLKANNAGEFADKFYLAGFYTLDTVKEEDINSLIGADKVGIRRTLISKLPSTKPGPVPAVPALPTGTTFDLSSPPATTPTGIAFQLPSKLPVASCQSAVIAPTSLSAGEWMVIARNSNMLYGYRMDGNEPKTANEPVLHWRVPASMDFVKSEFLRGDVKTVLTYTESSRNYVKQGFSTVTATASFPYCSGSAERETREKYAQSATVKRLFMQGIWHYPRATLDLEKCTVVSPRFVEEMTNALGLVTNRPLEGQIGEWRTQTGLEARQPSPEQQKRAKQALAGVEGVLNKYGHVVGSRVEVGGRLVYTHEEKASGETQQAEKMETIRAAVAIKTGTPDGGSGSVGASVGTGEKTGSDAKELAQTMTFEASGGDVMLTSAPHLWAETVKDPNLWTVIGLVLGGDEQKPNTTIDLLPDTLKVQVKDLWKKYGRRGILDGRTFKLLPEARKELVVKKVDSVHPVASYEIQTTGSDAQDEDAMWIFRCHKEDLYWIQHLRTRCWLRGHGGHNPDEAWIPYKPDKAGSVLLNGRGLWRVYPHDAGGVLGVNYQNSYLIEDQEFNKLLGHDGDMKAQADATPVENYLWELEEIEADDEGCPDDVRVEPVTSTLVEKRGPWGKSQGGDPFDDFAKDVGDLSTVEIHWMDRWGDSHQVLCRLKIRSLEGSKWSETAYRADPPSWPSRSVPFGEPDPKCFIIRLKPGDFIVAVDLKYDNFVRGIRLKVVRRNGKEEWFELGTAGSYHEFLDNIILHGFHGRGGHWMDAMGVSYTPYPGK